MLRPIAAMPARLRAPRQHAFFWSAAVWPPLSQRQPHETLANLLLFSALSAPISVRSVLNPLPVRLFDILWLNALGSAVITS